MPAPPAAPAETPGFGLWLFPDHDATTLTGVVVDGEQAGLDEVWLGDEGPARDPLVALAAAAPRTSRIGLGVAVTNPYLRHPATTASAFATLSELAPGRVVLGLGAGGGLALGPVGVERSDPVTRVAEAVRVARAVLCATSTDGYDPPPHAVRAPDVPIFIGARGERLNRLASEVADGVFLGGVPMPMMGPTLAWARSRQPLAAALYPNVAFTAEEVEVIRPLLVYAFTDGPPQTSSMLGVDPDAAGRAARALADGDDGPARAVVDHRVLSTLLISGTVDEIGRQLGDLARRHRATSVGVAYVGQDPRGVLERVAATAYAFRRAVA
jgi:5,10-methylenetetrahydromethanopterin reductase